MDILQMVKEAQSKLRATQINWQEDCLFECDDILTGVIRELENAQHKEKKMNTEVTSNEMADTVATCEYCDRIVDTPNYAYHICTGRKVYKGTKAAQQTCGDSAPPPSLSTPEADSPAEVLPTPPTSG